MLYLKKKENKMENFSLLTCHLPEWHDWTKDILMLGQYIWGENDKINKIKKSRLRKKNIS